MTDGAETERALSPTATGLRAAATRLDAATVLEGRLHVDGAPLTAERLTLAVEAAVADAGGEDVDVCIGPCGDGLRPDDPVVVVLRPAAPAAAPLARTFVVDGGGGWDRRAAVAVGMVHDAVTRVAEPGRPAGRLVDEAVAELGAYGLAPAETPTVWTAAGDPIDRSEEASLAAGDVFALDPTAVDPDPDADRGRIRIGRYYTVTGSGCRALGDLPTSLLPGAY